MDDAPSDDPRTRHDAPGGAPTDGAARVVDEPASGRPLAWMRVAALVLVVATLVVVSIGWGADSIADRLDDASSSWSGMAVFVTLYAAATVLLVPGTASTITAGLVFGTLVGTAVAVAGATIGAVAAYVIARSIARDAVVGLIPPKAREMERWIDERQFRSMLALRLLPIVPFNLLNYAAGLSPVRPVPYAAATVVGIVPATAVITAVGSSAREPTGAAFVVSIGLFAALVLGSSIAARRFTRPSSDSPSPPSRS